MIEMNKKGKMEAMEMYMKVIMNEAMADMALVFYRSKNALMKEMSYLIMMAIFQIAQTTSLNALMP